MVAGSHVGWCLVCCARGIVAKELGWGYLAWSTGRKALVVGTGDKIDNQAEVLKGKVKEAVGHATADPELEGEGEVDQAKGHVKQAGEKVKDSAKDIIGK